MSLIDTSYFIGPWQIAGLSSVHVRARVEAFIEEYEPEFLRLLMGDEFYADYLAGLESEEASIWEALQSEDLKKAITCFVYYYWLRDKETLTTSLGEAKPQVENAAAVSSVNKQVYAWNSMVEFTRKVYRFLDTNKSDYPTWRTDYQYYITDHRGVYGRNPITQPINNMNI